MVLRSKTNWEKCDFCGVDVEESMLIQYFSRLSCKVESFQLSYPGLHLGGYSKSKKFCFWQPVIEKIQKTFDWLKIIKSIEEDAWFYVIRYSHAYLCYMPSFHILSMVGLELDCLLRAFFWEGREGSQIHHLVRLNFRSQAQVIGGFGFETLKPIPLPLSQYVVGDSFKNLVPFEIC